MAAYSTDLRLRVLRDADAGLPSDELAEKYSVSRAWVDRLKQRRRETGEVAPRKQTRWRTPILQAQLAELAALIREQPDRTLAELQEALRTPASLPTLCRTIKRLGFRFKKNGTRVGTCLGAQLAISVNNCPPPRDPRSRMTSVKRTQRKYVQKAYRVRNWREYETSLRARGSLTVWLGLTDGKLANWHSPRPTRRKPGRQRKYSNHAIETTVTLGLVFGLKSRQTEGFLRSLLTLLNLDNDVPRPQHDLEAQGEAGEGCFLREANREARPPPHRQQRSFSARRPVAHSAESQGLPQAAPRCG